MKLRRSGGGGPPFKDEALLQRLETVELRGLNSSMFYVIYYKLLRLQNLNGVFHSIA